MHTCKEQKKRHTANSDTDSENGYPASQPTNSSSSTTTKNPYVPRFVIIHPEEEMETISSLSPFVVHKTIMSIAGEPKSIKNLRSSDLLIQCAKESHEKGLLQMKTFCGLKCSVTTHGVTDVRRIAIRRDGVIKLTNTYVLTFNSPNLPTVVKIDFMQVKVVVYIPTHFDVTLVKCLVTTKINEIDTLYAATAVSPNIVDQLACVTNQPNVSTVQVITL